MMQIYTIHKNAGGTVVNPISASGIQIDGPCGERLVLNITDSGVEISVSGFAATSSSGDSRDRSLRARLDFHCSPAMPPADDNGFRICYQCGRQTTWLAPDSRCGTCTRLTADEVRGE